ncbi:MAG: hypothetical protein HN637_07090 [Gammaproteobacteria bacterium]|nr:hypothetical protein [Gammaproteobacteria bacterium]
MFEVRNVASKAVSFAFITMLVLFGTIVNADSSRELVSDENRVVLAVENMTWAGCVVAVRNSLRALEGVREVEVDLDENMAVVIYESAKLNVSKLTEATTNIGFPSVVKVPEAE